MINAFETHVSIDDYHLALNKVFTPIFQGSQKKVSKGSNSNNPAAKESSKQKASDEKAEKIYKNMWRYLSSSALNRRWIPMLGPTEEARLTPLLSGLEKCKV